MSRRTRRNRRNRFAEGEDLNPMNFVSNLSDVMLILAVGIMLALILHWNVNIESSDPATDAQNDNAISFSDEDLHDQEVLPENMQPMGQVYYDAESGRYFIVQSGN